MVDNRVTLKISPQLHKFLNDNGNRGETFEGIIWRMITSYKLTDENKKNIKEAQRNYQKFL